MSTNSTTSKEGDSDDDSGWSAKTIVISLLLFVLAGIAEIGGGWLIWKAVREGSPKYWMVLGSLVLIIYGFIPTLQPSQVVDSFGRVYAVYGGFFIVLSFLWGWALDGNRPDLGDMVGGLVALAGVLVILFWPREDEDE